MDRISRQTADGAYAVAADQISVEDGVARGAAVDRLRAAGRSKSYQFRELMGRKAMYRMILSLLERYGL